MIVPKRRPIRRSARNLALSCLFIAGLGLSTVHAEGQQEILFFTSIDTFDSFSESEPAVKDNFLRGSADVLYSYAGDRFRVLGEYLLSSDESELERIKLGWKLRDNLMLWLGRFHTPSKYWTTEFHHGQYLQTSITRPALEQWEDDSGPIPSHVTGLLLEYERQRKDKSVISLSSSVGLAPRFVGERLMPLDALDPTSGHGPSINLKLAYRPEILSPMQIGLLSGWSEIRVESESSPALADVDRVDQLTLGAFVDWRWNRLRLISSAVYFDNKLNYVNGPVNDSFVLTYLQFEFDVNDTVTLFGRTDNGFNEDLSPYLRLLPTFVAHRHMLGVRWDFAELQSLALELADTSRQGGDFSHENFKEFRLQWSAVFP